MPGRLFLVKDLRVMVIEMEWDLDRCIDELRERDLLNQLHDVSRKFRKYHVMHSIVQLPLGEDSEEVSYSDRHMAMTLSRAKHIASSFLRAQGFEMEGMCSNAWPCECEPELIETLFVEPSGNECDIFSKERANIMD